MQVYKYAFFESNVTRWYDERLTVCVFLDCKTQRDWSEVPLCSSVWYGNGVTTCKHIYYIISGKTSLFSFIYIIINIFHAANCKCIIVSKVDTLDSKRQAWQWYLESLHSSLVITKNHILCLSLAVTIYYNVYIIIIHPIVPVLVKSLH